MTARPTDQCNMLRQQNTLMISIVTPCWNETERLGSFIDRVRELPAVCEVILADASDDQRCRTSPVERGVTVVHCDHPTAAGR